MTDEIWTVRRILQWIESYLADRADDNPRLSAQWLVADALDASRLQLFIDMDRPLTPEERSILRDHTRRRGLGEPLQYITGTTAFRHIQLMVEKGVLIPRPETEVLVSEALALLPPAPKPQDAFEEERTLEETDPDSAESPSHGHAAWPAAAQHDDGEPKRLLVADICTGSGCIACSLAHEHPLVEVVATDIAPEAVSLARRNAAALKLDDRVTVIESDLGCSIETQLLGEFDLVVSNPPYVPSSLLESLPREVSDFEPALALDGGADGLDIFRRITDWCMEALKPGGGCAFELHESCLEAAREELLAKGFANASIHDDLAGRHRVLCARKP